jgi:hypothetical protein
VSDAIYVIQLNQSNLKKPKWIKTDESELCNLLSISEGGKMLLEEIQKQYITAFKSKDTLTTSVLGLLKSAIQYKQIDLKAQQKEMNDDIILDVIKAEVKKHKESIEQYDQANRKELADKERAELEILNRFLPVQMSRESVVGELTRVLSSFPPEEAKNFGKMMKEAMVTLKGKADGGLIKKELEVLIQKLP